VAGTRSARRANLAVAATLAGLIWTIQVIVALALV
jgi:hypothetical protein